MAISVRLLLFPWRWIHAVKIILGYRSYHTVYCDGCRSEHYTGRRYRCLQCRFFDLCEYCYHGKNFGPNNGNHLTSHRMQVILTPLDRRAFILLFANESICKFQRQFLAIKGLFAMVVEQKVWLESGTSVRFASIMISVNVVRRQKLLHVTMVLRQVQHTHLRTQWLRPTHRVCSYILLSIIGGIYVSFFSLYFSYFSNMESYLDQSAKWIGKSFGKPQLGYTRYQHTGR